MDVNEAVDELLVLARRQGFKVESLGDGRWHFERRGHHVIATISNCESFWMCLDELLGEWVLRQTREVRDFVNRCGRALPRVGAGTWGR